jgi:DNA-binding response OmpR family regulator
MASYILLVDDNSDLSDNLKLILELEGLQVRVASSGSDALQAIDEEIPSLIVADVVMPGANGYDLFKEVKANAASALIPFIFLSALTTAEDVNRGLKMGADAYITKPFVIADLLTTIHHYLQPSTQ